MNRRTSRSTWGERQEVGGKGKKPTGKRKYKNIKYATYKEPKQNWNNKKRKKEKKKVERQEKNFLNHFNVTKPNIFFFDDLQNRIVSILYNIL